MDTAILNKDSVNFLNTFNKRAKDILKGQNLLEMPLDEARKAFNKLMAPLSDTKLRPIDVDITNPAVLYNDITIPIRLYTPKNATRPLPILVYFHGGGFVFGDPDFLDYTCRFLCRGAHCIVASVDYRRAPEHKFPAAHNDAYHVTQYIYEHPKVFNGNGKIAVGGDSAGGNLAASVCHLARDAGEIIIYFQLLFYPWVDLNNTALSDKKFAKGFFLELDTLDWMRKQYLNGADEDKNPLANPQLQENFSRLPSALVVIGENDPIHDDAKLYYEKLVKAGVPAQFAEFGGILHDFCALPTHYDAASLACEMACNALKKAFYH